MCDKAMMRHVSDSKQFKDASHMYYRFIDDDKDEALLAATNAGNGTGVPIYGQGGNSWAFCPHTVNNSYIMDIGLAEEIERSVAGSHIDARQRAFEKLRNRVREEAEPEAPNWSLTQSQIVRVFFLLCVYVHVYVCVRLCVCVFVCLCLGLIHSY